jgi:hypothetical protein
MTLLGFPAKFLSNNGEELNAQYPLLRTGVHMQENEVLSPVKEGTMQFFGDHQIRSVHFFTFLSAL